MTAVAAILKIYFSFFSWNGRQVDLNLVSGSLVEKQLNLFRSEIQDCRYGCNLENSFFASSPEPKGQLTWNMIGSIGVTCKAKKKKKKKKKLKSFRSEIQKCRNGWHIENLFFASVPKKKGQLTWNLVGSIGETCRSKLAEIVQMGNQKIVAILKIYFSLLFLKWKANCFETL